MPQARRDALLHQRGEQVGAVGRGLDLLPDLLHVRLAGLHLGPHRVPVAAQVDPGVLQLAGEGLALVVGQALVGLDPALRRLVAVLAHVEELARQGGLGFPGQRVQEAGAVLDRHDRVPGLDAVGLHGLGDRGLEHHRVAVLILLGLLVRGLGEPLQILHEFVARRREAVRRAHELGELGRVHRRGGLLDLLLAQVAPEQLALLLGALGRRLALAGLLLVGGFPAGRRQLGEVVLRIGRGLLHQLVEPGLHVGGQARRQLAIAQPQHAPGHRVQRGGQVLVIGVERPAGQRAQLLARLGALVIVRLGLVLLGRFGRLGGLDRHRAQRVQLARPGERADGALRVVHDDPAAIARCARRHGHFPRHVSRQAPDRLVARVEDVPAARLDRGRIDGLRRVSVLELVVELLQRRLGRLGLSVVGLPQERVQPLALRADPAARAALALGRGRDDRNAVVQQPLSLRRVHDRVEHPPVLIRAHDEHVRPDPLVVAREQLGERRGALDRLIGLLRGQLLVVAGRLVRGRLESELA